MSEFKLNEAIQVLQNTPTVLCSLLGSISENWTRSGNDRNSWKPFDVVGHLIHGERTDWVPRARIILSHGCEYTFPPFDRTAQFDNAVGKNLEELLDEFTELRRKNLEILDSWGLTEVELEKEGIHPDLGTVKLRELLATWVAHDLGHIRQIVTVMANRYGGDVGPWRQYLSVIE